jgi:3-oxoacyl-[acyl-carrier protein] reductase
LFGAVEKQSGTVAISVTNSAVPPSKILRDTKVEDWKPAVDPLLMGTGEFCPRDASTHADERVGRLVTLSSSAVKQPVHGMLLSSALRAAVAGLAKTLASEYARLDAAAN